VGNLVLGSLSIFVGAQDTVNTAAMRAHSARTAHAHRTHGHFSVIGASCELQRSGSLVQVRGGLPTSELLWVAWLNCSKANLARVGAQILLGLDADWLIELGLGAGWPIETLIDQFARATFLGEVNTPLQLLLLIFSLYYLYIVIPSGNVSRCRNQLFQSTIFSTKFRTFTRFHQILNQFWFILSSQVKCFIVCLDKQIWHRTMTKDGSNALLERG